MVSKEEYNSYVEKLIDKKDACVKSLSLWYMLVSITMIIAGIVLCIFFFPFMLWSNFHLVSFILGVCLIIVSILMLNKRRDTKKIFREDIREKVIGYLLKDYTYRFDRIGYISSLEFDNSQFCGTYDCYCCGDALTVNIPNDDGSESKIDFQIGDVNAYDVEYDEKGNRSTRDVYKGVFGCVKFKSNFKCILTIDSKFKRKGVKFENVILEDINFNKKFKVKTNNQVEARYILTPNMMEKILLLESRIKNIKIVFADKNLYVGSEKVNLFELDKYRNDDVASIFDNLYDEIELILGIVDELKNNNKIFKM